MPIEEVLSAVAAVVAPALGLLLQASRRNRLLRRIEQQLQLAEQIAPHDPDTAIELRAVARDTARVLSRRDQQTLHRKLDPAAILAILFLTVPAIIGLVLTFRWDSSWRWPVAGLLIIWTLLWGGVGLTQLWDDGTDDKKVSPGTEGDTEIGTGEASDKQG